MKNKVVLLAITIIAVLAMGIVMGGCSCDKDSSKKTTVNPKNVPTANGQTNGSGDSVVEDQFPTISNKEVSTDKHGNEVVKYTNVEGNKVTRITKKNGVVKIIIKNKKGKVIETKQFKDEAAKAANEAVSKKQSQNKKKDSKKEDKKETKKDSKKKNQAGVANDNDDWSDFY
ncbi:MAG: hypothetical protein K6E58_04695 [Eubacterium sp.]|nr:hypothetical protein [Eubacterium sp.]